MTSWDVTQCAAVITWRSVTVTPVHPESSLTAVEKGNFCEANLFGMWKRLLNLDRSLLYLQGLRAPEKVSHIDEISDVLRQRFAHNERKKVFIFSRLCVVFMRRSNRNFNSLPPTGQSPGIWLFSVPGEWGIWSVRPSRRWGFDLCLGVVAKIEPFKFLFFGRWSR